MWGRGQDLPLSGSRGLGSAWGGGRGSPQPSAPTGGGWGGSAKGGPQPIFHPSLGKTHATLSLSFPIHRARRLDDGGL